MGSPEEHLVEHQVNIEWVTANLPVLVNMNAAAYSCTLYWFPTIVLFTQRLSNALCWFTGIDRCGQLLQSQVWEI